jgi:hypothetical protein
MLPDPISMPRLAVIVPHANIIDAPRFRAPPFSTVPVAAMVAVTGIF